MFEEKYKEAKKDLEYAFRMCHKDSIANKIKILELLIPINLLFGIFPEKELLTKYKIPHLNGIVEACKTGNLLLFNSEVEKYQQQLIDKGVYLLIIHIEPLLYRQIVEKILEFQKKRKKAGEFKRKPTIIAISVIS